MTLTPELVIALAGFCTAIVSVATQWRTGMVQARRDEVALLHEEIERLSTRCTKLETELDRERGNKLKLQDYIAILRVALISAGVALPEAPKLE